MTVPPWYSLIKSQAVYETAEVQAYWDVPVYWELRELRANRVDTRVQGCQQPTQVSHCNGDELPLGEQPSQEDAREDHEVQTSQMGDEAEAPRI